MNGGPQGCAPGGDPWAARGEDSVLKRCSRGDEAAWRLVHGFLLAVCRQAGRGQKEQAEDLSSGVLLKLVKGGIRGVQSDAAFRSYLRKAALCAVIDASRSATRRELSIDTPADGQGAPAAVEISDPGSSSEEGVLRREIRGVVQRILRDLSEDCRKLLRAYFRYKMGLIDDYRALSRVLGRPVGTISVQVGRCLRRFRDDPRAASLER